MKKILYIVSTLQKSGPTNQLFNIIKNLDRTTFEPYLISLSPEPKASLWFAYESLGFQMASLGFSRIEGLFFSLPALKKKVSEINPDIIHSQGARADIISSKLTYLNIPKICTVRNFPQDDYRMTYGAILGWYLTKAQTSAFRKLNLCCGVSKAVCDNLKTIFGINHIQTVLNGVDTQRYTSIDHAKKVQIRDDFGLPRDAIIWLSSLGKDKRKNSDYVVKSFLGFLKKKPNHYLVLIGEGQQSSVCESLAAGSKQIKFYGKVDNVKVFLNLADYFVSASKAEGMPNAVLEAMACGLPVLLSDIEPHKEIYSLSPNSVYLFSLNLESSLISALLNVNLELHDFQSTNSISLVFDKLSSIVMSNSYQAIYSELLSEFKQV